MSRYLPTLLLVLLLHLSFLNGYMGSSAVAAGASDVKKCSRQKRTAGQDQPPKTCTRTPSLSLTPSESETASLSHTPSETITVVPKAPAVDPPGKDTVTPDNKDKPNSTPTEGTKAKTDTNKENSDKVTKPPVKSATAISSTIPAVLI
eukprot:Tbor_TRINITY_DN5283_c0_g2::TRINITY_DN5283_c0_g2_i2::g.16791::m.16791